MDSGAMQDGPRRDAHEGRNTRWLCLAPSEQQGKVPGSQFSKPTSTFVNRGLSPAKSYFGRVTTAVMIVGETRK